ncbi:MAG: hypothetical protein R3C49_01610 [Planctomycetaceae bacterium]
MSSKFSSGQRSRSRARQLAAPAEVETFESRLLLTTTPTILAPTGTIQTDALVNNTPATVEFRWAAVDNAVSYDLWVSSLNSFERVLLQRNIAANTLTVPVTDLAQGGMRVWARANLLDGTQSAWSAGGDFQLKANPVLTGPTGISARRLTSDSTPVISWDAPLGNRGYQIWLVDVTRTAEQVAAATALNQTTQGISVSDTFFVQNDPAGTEIRSFEIPNTLAMGRYRVWVRAQNTLGTYTPWSEPLEFDVGPQPENLTPDSANPGDPPIQTFQDQPRFAWDAVANATDYDVWVQKRGTANPFFRRIVPANGLGTQSTQVIQSELKTPILENFNDVVDKAEIPLLDTFGKSVPVTLPDGIYDFWVRAVYRSAEFPDTVAPIFGAWSEAGSFQAVKPVTSFQGSLTWNARPGVTHYDVYLIRNGETAPLFRRVIRQMVQANSQRWSISLCPENPFWKTSTVLWKLQRRSPTTLSETP